MLESLPRIIEVIGAEENGKMVALQISPKIESFYGIDRQQEIIKIRERILHIGLIPKVILLKLFLDIVTSSSARILLVRCLDVFVDDPFFRYVSFQSKGKPPTLWRCLL